MAVEVLVWQHLTLAGLHNSQDWQDYDLARRNKRTIRARPTKLAWHARSVHWMYLQDNQIHSIQTSSRQSMNQAYATTYLISETKHGMISTKDINQTNIMTYTSMATTWYIKFTSNMATAKHSISSQSYQSTHGMTSWNYAENKLPIISNADIAC